MKKIFVVLLCLFAFCVRGQAPREVVDSLFYGSAGIQKQYPSVGISVGIIAGGKTQYYALGNLSKESPVKVNENTIFEIGSITKTFTALLLGAEVEKKAVGKADYMDRYLPQDIQLAEGLRQKVKLTDLASHQSGLPNLSSDRYIGSLLEADPAQPFKAVTTPYLVGILNETTQLTNYGRHQYNNYAFALLGLVIEKLEKADYNTVLTQAVLTPLKLTHTGLGEVTSPNAAGRYDTKGTPQEYIITNKLAPAGGLRSSTVDMVTYVKAQMNPVNTQLGRAMELTQQRFYEDPKKKVALGWEIVDRNGEQFFEKSGDSFGNSSLLRFDKKNKIGIVILANHQDAELVEKMADYLYKRLLPTDRQLK